MLITQTHELTPEERKTVRRIWNDEYPESLRLETPADFEQYLDNLSGKTHYLVKDGNTLLGWALTFERENASWFAMILDTSIHRKGIGSELLGRIKAENPLLYGWVIDHDTALKRNGTLYASPLGFYLRNGFSVEREVRLELPTISAVRILFTITCPDPSG